MPACGPGRHLSLSQEAQRGCPVSYCPSHAATPVGIADVADRITSMPGMTARAACQHLDGEQWERSIPEIWRPSWDGLALAESGHEPPILSKMNEDSMGVYLGGL
jgi:hypothetical protein